MNRKFKASTMTVKDLFREYKEQKIIIPQIQRSLVWKDKQKKELYQSIRKGFPFGVITFASLNENEKYVIDGLQRTTTIMAIYNNIFKHASQNDLQELLKKVMVKRGYDNAFTNDELQAILKNLTLFLIESDIKKAQSFESADVANFLARKYSRDGIARKKMDNNKLELLFTDAYKKLKNEINFDEYEIPFIEFMGSDEEAAELFVLINQNGSKLNKTDILKSKWRKIKMNFMDDDIKKLIEKRFENIETDFNVKSQEVTHLSPYDIIYYIFYKVFKNNQDFLKEQFIEDEKYLVNIDALVYLIKFFIYKKVNENGNEEWEKIDCNTDDKIGNNVAKIIISEDMVNEIIEDFQIAANVFNKIFNPLISFRNKNKLSKRLIPATAQTVAILGNIYAEIFNNKQFNPNEFIKKYQKRILLKFMLDKLNKTFGAGSSMKAYASMKEKSYLIQDTENELKIKINEIYENQIDSINNKFEQHTTKLIMSYVYKKIIKPDENFSQYEYESCIVVKPKLSELKGISCFANYSLGDKHRSETKNAWLEKEDIKYDAIYNYIKNKSEQKANDLKISFENLCNNLSQENYYNYLNLRKEIILDLIIKDE